MAEQDYIKRTEKKWNDSSKGHLSCHLNGEKIWEVLAFIYLLKKKVSAFIDNLKCH